MKGKAKQISIFIQAWGHLYKTIYLEFDWQKDYQNVQLKKRDSKKLTSSKKEFDRRLLWEQIES